MKSLIASFLSLTIFASVVSAGTVKIPKDDPVVSVEIPDSWKPEITEDGVETESPDQVATVFFEVSEPKELGELIEENLKWLTQDQKVKIDTATKKTKDFEANGLAWKTISWEGDSDEWGRANIGFMFVKIGKEDALTITYWITKKDREKQSDALNKILDSVKPITD